MYIGKVKNLLYIVIGFILMSSCSEQGKSSKNQTGSLQEQGTKKTPPYLYKVLSMDDWAKSCKTIHLSKMDADFIHLSMEEQLDKIIEKYWASAPEYVVLKIETSKLVGHLVFESNPGGTSKYYHLYNGSIPLTAIVELKLHKK